MIENRCDDCVGNLKFEGFLGKIFGKHEPKKANGFDSDDFSFLEVMDDSGSDSDSDNAVLEKTTGSSVDDLLYDMAYFVNADPNKVEVHFRQLLQLCTSEVEVASVLMTQSLVEEYVHTIRLMKQVHKKIGPFDDHLMWLYQGMAQDRFMIPSSMIPRSMILTSFETGKLDISECLAVDFESLKEKMNTFTTSAEKLCKREKVAFIQREHYFSRSDQGDSSSSRRSNTFKGTEEKEVVGFKEGVHKLLGMLHSGGTDELEILSIVGAAGGGKTTLAREVYDHPLTSQSFAIRAWVNVSQQYDKTMKWKLLIPILESAYPGVHEDYENSSDDKLGEETFKFLRGKKYLIVMDDMWSTEAWDDIQRSLPKECYGSKLLLTSRLPVQPNGIRCIDPLHLAPLSKDCSWELLRKKVFGQNCCPPELVGIGEHIAEKCQGLPLAIVAIAGILVMKEKKLEVWKEVSNHLSSTIAKNLDGCMAILELSYNHLPLYLKDCFVYIGGFPEDSEILVHELIWLWIGEGLIQQSEGDKSLEDVAEYYLSDLIKRNLVMVAREGSFRGIKACCIHDLLRELCLQKAKENNFLLQMYKVDSFSPSATLNHHRLFIGSRFFQELSLRPGTQNLRSFLCFNLENSNTSSFELDLSFIAEKFELLRVLSFTSAICQGEIGEGYLVHLRYLAFQVPPDKIFPFQLPFSYLFNLETLHLQARVIMSQEQCIMLPRSIFKMVKLRHLYAKRGVFRYHHDNWYSPDNIFKKVKLMYLHAKRWGLPKHHDDQDSANEEPGSSFESPSKLDSLWTLHSICPCKKCRNFLARTPNLRKLRISGPRLLLSWSDSTMNPDLEFLKFLETLSISSCSINGPLKFPQTLTQLTLQFTRLDWEQLSSLQTLPRLEVLKLLSLASEEKIWNMSELEGFPQLKYLSLKGLAVKRWQATEDQFPKLEVLVVNCCLLLKRIPIDFANLNELRKIEVRRCSHSLEESARKIQEERINERGDDGRLELLVEDNLLMK